MGRLPNTSQLVSALYYGLLVSLLIIGHKPACAEIGQSLAEAIRINVAQITAVRPDGVESGFGFIVAEEDQSLLIVTANHVVRGRGPGSAATGLKVRFFPNPSLEYDGQLLEPSSQQYDLAVIRAPAPEGLEWQREVQADSGQTGRGSPVWFVGRGRDWFVPTSPGILRDMTLDFGIQIDRLDVAVGSSGAPVIGDNGIIGLLTRHDGAVAEALAIEQVQRAMEIWSLPWQLKSHVSRIAVSGLAPKAEMHLAAGEQFMASANYVRAFSEFEQALQSDSRNSKILFLMATALRHQLWRELGMPAEILPETTAMYGRAEFLQMADDALAVIYRARTIDPEIASDPNWLLEESYLLRARGSWLKAGEVAEQAYRSAPDNPEAMAELGMLKSLVTSRNFDEATRRSRSEEGLQLLTRATKEFPANPRFQYYLGRVLKLSDILGAVRAFDKARLAQAEIPDAALYRKAALNELSDTFSEWGRLGYASNLPEDLAREFIPIAESIITNSNDFQTRTDTSLVLAFAYHVVGESDRGVNLLMDTVGKYVGKSGRYVAQHQLIALGRLLSRIGAHPEVLTVTDLLLGRETILGANLDHSLIITWHWGTGLAKLAGLQVGDKVLKVNGLPVESPLELVNAMMRSNTGDPVSFEIQREFSTIVNTAPRPAFPEPSHRRSILGVTLDSTQDSVVIDSLSPGGAAEQAGVAVGDQVSRINNTSVTSALHFVYLVHGLSVDRPAEMLVLRDQKWITLEVHVQDQGGS